MPANQHARISWLGRFCAIVLLLGVACVALSACGGSTSQKTNAAPPDQQVFHVVTTASGNTADIETMDPSQVTGTTLFIMLVFPGLVTLDQNLAPTAWAAQKLPDVDPSGMVYTFHLRPNMHFTDGEPIDAGAFAYSIDRVANPCTASPVASYLSAIKDADLFHHETCDTASGKPNGAIQSLIGDSLVASDSLTLQVTLTRPASYFLEAFTYPTSYAVPRQLIDTYGAHWTDHLVGMGGGLFKVGLWDHRGQMRLDRNDAFWGAKSQLKSIAVTVYQDAETAYTDYLAGSNDLVGVPADRLADAKARSDYTEIPQLWINYLQPNWAVAPFDDVAARQAFALAIDKDALLSSVYKSAGVATNHIVPNGMPGYNAALLGPDATANTSGNVARAKALIDDYAARKCGGNIAHCPPVQFSYNVKSATTVNVADALMPMWQQTLGYPVTANPLLYSQITTNASHLQLYYASWIADYPHPQDWLSLFFEPGASYNTMGVKLPDVTATLQQADAMSDPTQYLPLYQQVEQKMVTQVGWIPLRQVTSAYLLRPWVVGYHQNAQGLIGNAEWQQMYIEAH